jgi:hypothetical protein
MLANNSGRAMASTAAAMADTTIAAMSASEPLRPKIEPNEL